MIIADRAAGGEWHGDDALALLKRIIRLAPHRLIVCAGAAQRELVERGVRELRLERSKIFGSAPEALAAAVRAIVAAETDVSPRDVALTVLGVPPSQIVVPWENATVSGFAATAGLAEPARRALAGRIARLWPPGPLALASAAAKTVEAAFGRTRQTVSVFVAPDDSQGRRARTAALLARIGPAGIELLELALNARDRVALESAMLI
jgi:malate/lactate dehydrogenase